MSKRKEIWTPYPKMSCSEIVQALRLLEVMDITEQDLIKPQAPTIFKLYGFRLNYE